MSTRDFSFLLCVWSWQEKNKEAVWLLIVTREYSGWDNLPHTTDNCPHKGAVVDFFWPCGKF